MVKVDISLFLGLQCRLTNLAFLFSSRMCTKNFADFLKFSQVIVDRERASQCISKNMVLNYALYKNLQNVSDVEMLARSCHCSLFSVTKTYSDRSICWCLCSEYAIVHPSFYEKLLLVSFRLLCAEPWNLYNLPWNLN